MTAQNASAVATVCRLLDGLPLALELAAARVRLLSPQALAARMTRRLALLQDGARDLPACQQTLRATLDWSHDLLDDAQRRVFAQLAVFVGGCTLEAAEHVCHEEPELLEHLFSLADHSLLRVHEGGEPRFSFLQVVREYALEKFTAAPGADALQDRHAAYFLELAEAAVPGLKGPEQRAWLERVEAEHDNMRTALAWCAERRDRASSLRLGVALRWFWMMRGHFMEGRRWLEVALAAPGEVAPLLQAAALSAAGTLVWRQGDYAIAKTHFEEALALRRAVEDAEGVAGSLLSLGTLTFGQGNYGEARALLEEALLLQRELGDEDGVASSLLALGNVALDQGRREARTLYEESLALSRRLGDDLGVAYALDNLGVLAWHEERDDAQHLTEEALVRYRKLGSRLGVANATHRLGLLAYGRGDDEAARAFYEESLTIKRSLGEARGVTFVLYDLGRLALRGNDLVAAEAAFGEGLALIRPLGARTLATLFLEGLAALKRRRGETARAARLWAAAAAWCEGAGVPVPPVNRREHESELEALCNSMSETAFAREWQAGRALSFEQAVAEALGA